MHAKDFEGVTKIMSTIKNILCIVLVVVLTVGLLGCGGSVESGGNSGAIVAVENFSEGLAVVSKNGLYGYIDTSGNIVIPINFVEATSFRDGIAQVSLEDEDNTSYKALIDTQGNIVFDYRDYQDKYTEMFDYSEGLIGVSKHEESYDKNETSYGFINIDGEVVIPLQNEWEIQPETTFSDGVAWVKKDKSWYIINNKGERQTSSDSLPLQSVSAFHEGYAIGETPTWDTVIVDSKGGATRFMLPSKPDYLGDCSQGLFAYGIDYGGYSSDYGYANVDGDRIIDLSDYDVTTLSDFNEDLAVVFFKGKDEKSYCTYIDKSGEFVLEPQNEYSFGIFSEDHAVWTEWDTSTGLYGYVVDKNFNKVSDRIQFDDIIDAKFSNGYCIVQKDGKAMFMDNSGNMLEITES